MQSEYRKENANTYLWILQEKEDTSGYMDKMLQYNPGDGRLECVKIQENGREFYRYHITGKKALNGVYAMKPVGERQIRDILCRVFQIVDEAKEYLLEENDFVLLPDYIFTTLPKMEVELCYIPGYGIPLKEQLEGLFEYLLNRVDYEDKKAVELLYDCYLLCLQEKSEIREIRERLEQPSEEEQESRIQCETREAFLQEQEEEGASGGSYVSWLADRFFHRKKKDALLVAEQREEYFAEKKQGEDPGLMQKTELLSGPRDKEEAQLINEETGEVHFMKTFPFYIGSIKQYADCVLKQAGVSRIHCCIRKKEEKYYLADLNSTNGTYLDHREVVPGKEELLWDGAVIRVAKTEFYVKLPCHS
ncbi:MAG: FHA domain-containing protein [Lachnospiraceae bacterium]|nr:FHA domain-containing protein [Lachnospiraceae bacterium]